MGDGTHVGANERCPAFLDMPYSTLANGISAFPAASSQINLAETGY